MEYKRELLFFVFPLRANFAYCFRCTEMANTGNAHAERNEDSRRSDSRRCGTSNTSRTEECIQTTKTRTDKEEKYGEQKAVEISHFRVTLGLYS